MTNHTQAAGLDASIDVEDADADAESKEPTGETDQSMVGKLLRQGADAPDAADIEDPDTQL